MAAGLNHFTWILAIRDRESGQDLYPWLREAAKCVADDFEPLSMELFQIFDYCPVPGDSHLAEYLPWTHDSAAKPWEFYNLRLYNWHGGMIQRNDGHGAILGMISGKVDSDRLLNLPSEGATEIIEAVVTDGNYYDESVNLPNHGAIANLPNETIVEVPAFINHQGANAKRIGPLPEPIAELCRREAALVELVVEAAVTGDRQAALQALLMDPMINDIQRAKSILEDYLRTFADYLPQF